MAPEAPAVNPPGAAAPGTTTISETPEFKSALKEALTQAREEMRLNFEAEYRRRDRERPDDHAPQPRATDGEDFFEGWGKRHGVPADAGRELVEGIVGYMNQTVLPAALKPISESQKRQELRTQRSDLRAGNLKLAKLDDRFHAEVTKMLDGLKPGQVGPDSYARALHMVIGANIETLDAEKGKEAAREAEPAPGPEPLPNSAPAADKATTLNAKQKAFCEEKGFTDKEYTVMMQERARKLEGRGMTKAQVRAQLGDLLGTIEF